MFFPVHSERDQQSVDKRQRSRQGINEGSHGRLRQKLDVRMLGHRCSVTVCYRYRRGTVLSGVFHAVDGAGRVSRVGNADHDITLTYRQYLLEKLIRAGTPDKHDIIEKHRKVEMHELRQGCRCPDAHDIYLACIEDGIDSLLEFGFIYRSECILEILDILAHYAADRISLIGELFGKIKSLNGCKLGLEFLFKCSLEFGIAFVAQFGREPYDRGLGHTDDLTQPGSRHICSLVVALKDIICYGLMSLAH